MVPIVSRPDVLFVDAESVAARFLPVLRDQYRLTVASTASAALHALRHALPDLVVTCQISPVGSHSFSPDRGPLQPRRACHSPVCFLLDQY
jgi:hypothetical protein